MPTLLVLRAGGVEVGDAALIPTGTFATATILDSAGGVVTGGAAGDNTAGADHSG